MSKSNAECGVRSAELGKVTARQSLTLPGLSVQVADAALLDLIRERDLARSERDLMERMYHGSLGTAENCSKLNLALKEWQLDAMPAVRAVREILSQRPELHGPDGIVRAILNGKRPVGAPGLQLSESVCVGEIVDAPDGAAHLRCANCSVLVAKLSQEQRQSLNFPDPAGLQAHWQQEWARHMAGKGATPLPSPLPDRGGEGEDSVVCPCVCQLCKRGVHCSTGQCPHACKPPNAGVKQAFPKGRWSR